MIKFKKKKNIKPNETILDSEKFMYVEEKPDTQADDEKMQIDYTLLPASEAGKVALGCSVVGIVFMAICGFLMVRQGMEPELNATAAALCSMVWCIAAVLFAWKGVRIKNRSYVNCYVALALAGVLLMTWIITFLITTKI